MVAPFGPSPGVARVVSLRSLRVPPRHYLPGTAWGKVQEYGFSAKLLQLLKQIAPTVSRAAVIRDPLGPGGLGQLGALQGAAFILGMELTPVDPTNVGEMERAIMDFAGRPNGGVVVPASAVAGFYRRDVIIALATQHRLPAVYSRRGFVAEGGLIPTGSTCPTCSGARPDMSIASSGARSRPICRFRWRPSSKR